jgi:hypothetical protein
MRSWKRKAPFLPLSLDVYGTVISVSARPRETIESTNLAMDSPSTKGHIWKLKTSWYPRMCCLKIRFFEWWGLVGGFLRFEEFAQSKLVRLNRWTTPSQDEAIGSHNCEENMLSGNLALIDDLSKKARSETRKRDQYINLIDVDDEHQPIKPNSDLQVKVMPTSNPLKITNLVAAPTTPVPGSILPVPSSM